MVLRGVYDPMNQSGSKSKRKLPPSDVYYFTPDGKKLVCVTGSVIICFMICFIHVSSSLEYSTDWMKCNIVLIKLNLKRMTSSFLEMQM